MRAARLRHKVTIYPSQKDRAAYNLPESVTRFVELRGQTALERQTADASHGVDLMQLEARYDEQMKLIRSDWFVENADGITFRVMSSRDPEGRGRTIVCVLARQPRRASNG